ncbi:MAG TPA: hypothetical protein VFO36_09435, partial [Nitrospiraceae bacterium]|nr:hypothetical protein [Nitrospiraceae bacterium]
SDGPRIHAPKRSGFGSKVIKNMIELSLDGEVKLEYAPSGFSWQLACPTAKIRDHEGPDGPTNEKKADP